MKKKKIVIIEDNNNYLVNKNENLLFARHKLNEQSIKIMSCLICMIKKDDEDFHEYIFTSDEFGKLINNKNKNIITEMIKNANELLDKKIKIDLGDSIIETHMIISFKYEKLKGEYIKFMIHPDLKPFVLKLKKNFLSYDIKNILELKSSYSIRLYELLKHQYNQQTKYTKNPFKVFKIDLEELRKMFKIPQSYKFYEIKKHILEYSKKQFEEKTDIFFTYETNKKFGKKIDEIIFIIGENKRDSYLIKVGSVTMTP